MCCERIERQLGRYIDRELSVEDRDKVEAHLEFCSGCRDELEELRRLVAGIADPPSVSVPESLWRGVLLRLDRAGHAETRTSSAKRIQLRKARWAVAAGVMLAIGAGLVGLSSWESPARASTVDFGVLLNALPLDAQKAFRRFLVRYDGRPTTPIAAKRAAARLNFDTPSVLPGGFQLQTVYELRIGGTPGIAAAYDRDGEFLAVVFHRPMKHENFGSHQDLPCVIGEHCGHKVQVGEWKLVHLTDPTTCHCLLSRLDEKQEIPAVMAAIAPEPTGTQIQSGPYHP